MITCSINVCLHLHLQHLKNHQIRKYLHLNIKLQPFVLNILLIKILEKFLNILFTCKFVLSVLHLNLFLFLQLTCSFRKITIPNPVIQFLILNKKKLRIKYNKILKTFFNEHASTILSNFSLSYGLPNIMFCLMLAVNTQGCCET